MEEGKVIINDPVLIVNDDRGLEGLQITSHFVTFSTLSVIDLTILLSLILRYLGSLSLVRRGLLLYIYKEILTIFMCIQWVWFTLVVLCYVSGNGTIIESTIAKVMSYFFTFFLIQFLLALNILSAIKLYMTKKCFWIHLCHGKIAKIGTHQWWQR